MDSRSVRTAADARALVEARGLSHVKLGVADLDGVIRGKYLARDKFFRHFFGAGLALTAAFRSKSGVDCGFADGGRGLTYFLSSVSLCCS